MSQRPKVEVTGTVIDFDTKLPLEYATIVLTPLKGKKLTGGITDSKGNFSVEVPKGSYNISVEFISFKTKTFQNKILTANINLGVIPLKINAESLNEVEIIAEKSTVEIRLDKKIYNVGKDMTVKGGSASDVLDNVPSVSVDVEGNVSLRGNDNVRILVNGKPSGLVGLSGTDALRQLPADAIEKVEVITSPSARYEAEGTAGILNIVLRKGKALGFNGSVSANIGEPERYGASANLNYRTKKVNFFTYLGYNFRTSPGNAFTDMIVYDNLDAIDYYRNEKTDYNRERKGINSRFGIEYYLSENSSITGTFLYRNSDGEDIGTNYLDVLDNNLLLTESSIREELETEDDKTIEYNLNYTKDFNKSGHKLTFDFQYNESDETEFNFIDDNTTYPSFEQEADERITTTESNKELQIKGDYTLPIGENKQFEAGFNLNFEDLTSNYLVEDETIDNVTGEIISGVFANNTNLSNSLDFKQDIYAFYIQFGNKINKFSYLLGLRSETTERSIKLIDSNEEFNKKFTELFPTVNLGLELNDTESITLGYSRRLRRPRHFFLNPFESRTSETYIRRGNINLDPTYTSSFDLGYLKKWDKFTLNSSMYYQYSTNVFEMVQDEEYREIDGEETLVIIRTPINFGSQNRYGFEFTANYNPFKWWRISSSFNFFKSEMEGDYNGISYDNDDTSWFTRLTSRITLPGKIDWQTRGMYMAPFESALSKRKSMTSVNLAFSKDILKEKGTLALNVSDLFNSRKRRSDSFSDNTYSYGEFQYRERQISLNFTYRFNQKKKRERQGSYDNDGGDEMF
ncbi:TonB-dependent receptor domain-containing protein [Lutibacter oricola]|nr:TonB-dependent receptor [Lutibacter oricola]